MESYRQRMPKMRTDAHPILSKQSPRDTRRVRIMFLDTSAGSLEDECETVVQTPEGPVRCHAKTFEGEDVVVEFTKEKGLQEKDSVPVKLSDLSRSRSDFGHSLIC